VLSNVIRKFFGSSSEREVKRLEPVLREVRGHEQRFARMPNEALRAQTARFKTIVDPQVESLLTELETRDLDDDVFRRQLNEGLREVLDPLLPEAFAVVCEAAKRVAGMRPFDVQVVGGVVLHQGKIAEMVTGEGKTLVATLPVYLNALTGLGVHVVTVNDFLARRDFHWMGPIYEFLGLTAGLIQHDMGAQERQVGYRADITYGTNNEFGFDYLRDNMAVRADERVQRNLSYAIVDEIDSILIDEARTPLIISGRPEKSSDTYYRVDEIVRQLRKEQDYEAEEKGQHVMLTEEGMVKAERLLGVDNLYTNEHIGTVHMIEQALRAHNFFKRDDEYVVNGQGEVLIVDEFTGRTLEGRRYSNGLHQAIEAKERVPIQFESQTIASITYQNYFKLYHKLAGMTGTAATEAAEFAQIYDLDVVRIPTNLPLVREDMTDLVFGTEPGKFRYVAGEIARIHETGRPVLVGTVSIEKSELLGDTLKEQGVTNFEVLNAKHHGREAAIVANAGKRGAITIATNMAGRGTDIKLGEGVRELGGLAIIGTERHESRRIDNQLRGRCGRQGDPGTTRFYLSLEDEVARLFGGDKVKRMLEFLGSQDQIDEEPLNQRMVSRTIEKSQRRVEEYNFEIRKHVKEYDDVMDKQRRVIYKLRRDVLEDRDISGQIRDMLDGLVNDAVQDYAPEDSLPDQWDLEGLESRINYVFGMVPDLSGAEEDPPKPLVDSVTGQLLDEYDSRERHLADFLRERYEERFGKDSGQVDFARLARKRMHAYEKMALLRAVDDHWIDHLYSMDYLRESVRLRAYGQKDPLVEYKAEGFEMFQTMMASIEENVLQTLFRLTDPSLQRERAAAQKTGQALDDPFEALHRYSYVAVDSQQDRSFAAYDTSRFALAGQADQASAGPATATQTEERPKQRPVKHQAPKTKPNDPCPCGSGKKYKKCCGRV
jgi:preprotein translocase subunit SecA